MYPLLLTYKNLFFQLLLSITLSLLLHFLSIPSLFLSGLNTYIHPDDVTPSKPNSSPKVALRRPSDPNPNPNNGFQPKTASDLRNRKKQQPHKQKFEFDESKAQIFRLRLNDAHVQSRLFYDSYRSCFNVFVVGLACFGLDMYLNKNVGRGGGVLVDGSLVPIVIGCLGLFRGLVSLFRVSCERSGFRRSERQFGLVVGLLGFVVVLVICLGVYPWIVDFKFGAVDGYGRLFVAVLGGFVAGFVYLAAGKNARAFWVGTDQIRCNLPITQCGWFAQLILYANYVMLGFVSLLWIKPFADILVNKDIVDGGQSGGRIVDAGHREKLVGNVGMKEADFVNFRLWCLLISGLLQVLALRPNVQTYLNEAVLSWYQRLHSSTVPDMGYSRAKVFLHNHYLCLATIQFLAPGVLILLSLGLSQVGGGLFENFQVACGVLPCSAFVGEVALFIAWWVAFVWFVFTSAYLGFYRRGILYVS